MKRKNYAALQNRNDFREDYYLLLKIARDIDYSNARFQFHAKRLMLMKCTIFLCVCVYVWCVNESVDVFDLREWKE